MKVNKFLLCSLITLLAGTSVLWSASLQNTTWTENYDGSDANTVYLWNMDELNLPPENALSVKDIITGNENRLFVGGDCQAQVEGKWGYGVSFPGGDDPNDRLLTLRDALGTDPNNGTDFVGSDASFTVELWAKNAGIPESNNVDAVTQYLISKTPNGYKDVNDGFNLYLVRTKDGTQRVFLRGGIGLVQGTDPNTAYMQYNMSGVIDANESGWIHYAMTWDADTDTAKLFVNGKQSESMTVPNGVYVPNKSQKLQVGQRIVATHGTWHGVLDNVRFSNVAYEFQTPAHIDPEGKYYGWMEEYDGGAVGNRALWRFNYEDMYKYGHDPCNWPDPRCLNRALGEDNFERTYTEKGAEYLSADGKFGMGALLPGDYGNDYLSVYRNPRYLFPYQGDDVTNRAVDPSLSAEAWIKLAGDIPDRVIDSIYSDDMGPDVNNMIIIDKKGTWNCGYSLELVAVDVNSYVYDLNFSVGLKKHTSDANMTFTTSTGDFSFDPNTWYHVAGTWDRETDTAKVYINGAEMGSATTLEGYELVDKLPDLSVDGLQCSVGGVKDWIDYAGQTYRKYVKNFMGVIDNVRVSVVPYEYGAIPEVCGDPGTVYLPGDISGPSGEPDCKVDLFDLSAMTLEWLNCTDPADSRCDEYWK